MNTILNLFFTFAKIGLFSIGGGYAVIPLIREQVVETSGWISSKVFTDIITISQMTPGPLAVNTSTFVGLQIGGIAGAVAATAGCVICGIIISILLFGFFKKHHDSSFVFEILGGLKSASLGLIISAAATIVFTAFFGVSEFDISEVLKLMNWLALIIFAVMLFILRKWKLNPILVMLMSGAAGLLLYL